ncbi:MAG: regulatory protein RecX [Bacteroidales bacterium]
MENELSKYLTRAMKLCSRSETCTFDMRQKLTQWLIQEEDVEKILEELTRQSFIDDNRYAKALVKDKTYLNKWGKQKTRYFLKMKNIGDKTIQDALDEIQQDEYQNMVEKELHKKFFTLKNHPPLKQKSSLVSFGQNRGYEFELIMNIVEKLIKPLR